MQESRMRLIGRGIVIGLCALACVVALALHTQRVAAAGYTVATPSGSGPGSLLDAIRQVNAGAGTGDTITITATGTITPDIALPEILKPLAITGPGTALLTVSGGNTVQVFFVGSGVTASISNLTIANGNPNNVASGDGGGIRNDGTLTVTNTTLSGNSAGGGGGGGIFNVGMLTMTNTTLSSNTATGVFGDGGGIFNQGTLTVTNCILSSNTATAGGGGIYNSGGMVTMTNSTLSGNGAPDGGTGGGFDNDANGTINLINSTLSGNTAGYGGGIYINSGTVTVTNSTLSGNSAVLFSASGGYGGGIENGNGTLTLTNSTLTGNSASSYDGGGIETFGTSNLTNTIVAGNTAARNGPDINGAVTTTDHNLIGTTSGTTGITNGMHGDIVNPMPNLGPLASNGGPTQTRALLAGSPAIGAGDSSVCNSTTTPPGAPVGGKDQRGFPRLATACSIGAFEPQTITLAPTTLPNATLGTPYSQTLTATGGTAPYTFAVTGGTLPPGLTLATTGTLSGTPTGAGSFTFTVTATDHGGATGSRAYTLAVSAPNPNPLPLPRSGGGTSGSSPNARPEARPTVPVAPGGPPAPMPVSRH